MAAGSAAAAATASWWGLRLVERRTAREARSARLESIEGRLAVLMEIGRHDVTQAPRIRALQAGLVADWLRVPVGDRERMPTVAEVGFAAPFAVDLVPKAILELVQVLSGDH